MEPTEFEGKHSEVTDKILTALYKVHRTLGFGFGEKVYENALAYELQKLGMHVRQQEEIEVFYEGQSVGKYGPDLIVNDVVILELKSG